MGPQTTAHSMSHTPAIEIHHPHFVYRIYDAEDRLLYVGCARNVDDRMFLHSAWSSQSPTSWEIRERMVRHTSQKFSTKLRAHAEEIRAIRKEAPLLNKQHNPTRFRRENGVYVALQSVSAIETRELRTI